MSEKVNPPQNAEPSVPASPLEAGVTGRASPHFTMTIPEGAVFASPALKVHPDDVSSTNQQSLHSVSMTESKMEKSHKMSWIDRLKAKFNSLAKSDQGIKNPYMKSLKDIFLIAQAVFIGIVYSAFVSGDIMSPENLWILKMVVTATLFFSWGYFLRFMRYSTFRVFVGCMTTIFIIAIVEKLMG